MADTKISALAAATLTAADAVPVVSGGATKKTTAGDIVALIGTTGYANSRYWYPYLASCVSTTAAITANRIYHFPFFVGKKTTFTRIGIEVTTGAGSSAARLGIYNVANGSPTTRILDAGAVDTSGTGQKEITISQELDVGFYSIVVVADTNITLRACQNPSPGFAAVFGNSTPALSNYICYETTTGNTLPATSAGLSFITTFIAAPAVWMRTI